MIVGVILVTNINVSVPSPMTFEYLARRDVLFFPENSGACQYIYIRPICAAVPPRDPSSCCLRCGEERGKVFTYDRIEFGGPISVYSNEVFAGSCFYRRGVGVRVMHR